MNHSKSRQKQNDALCRIKEIRASQGLMEKLKFLCPWCAALSLADGKKDAATCCKPQSLPYKKMERSSRSHLFPEPKHRFQSSRKPIITALCCWFSALLEPQRLWLRDVFVRAKWISRRDLLPLEIKHPLSLYRLAKVESKTHSVLLSGCWNFSCCIYSWLRYSSFWSLVIHTFEGRKFARG